MVPQALKLALTMAVPFLKGGPVGSARIVTAMTWLAPVHCRPAMYPVPRAIDLPTASSIVTVLSMGNDPLGHDAVTVTTTSTFAVNVAFGSTLTLTPLSARATVADATAMIARVGTTSARRASLGISCLLQYSGRTGGRSHVAAVASTGQRR